MWLLVLASLLWAPSFPLVKRLGLDPELLTAARLVLAAGTFQLLGIVARLGGEAAQPVPSLTGSLKRRLCALGAVQFGLMYVLVHRSYAHLQGHEVALFTVLTPLWVALFAGLAERRLETRALIAGLVAVLGSLFLCRLELRPTAWRGFLLVQGANACFAYGQVAYRGIARRVALPHTAAFRWAYLGAALVAVAAAATTVTGSVVESFLARPIGTHAAVLYLGLVPTALGFHLWNRGAARVSTGTLAAANQLKVPLVVLVSVAPPFREPIDLPRLLAAAALIGGAVWWGRGATPRTRSARTSERYPA